MLSILAVTFPFFALVLGGYAATRLGALPRASIPGLNTFVLYFALPCFLYRFGSTTPILQYVHGSAAVVYLAGSAVVVALAVALARSRRVDWNNAAFGALVAAFPNTGYMGVPMLVEVLGKAAAGPAIATILLDLVLTSSLCVGLSRVGSAGPNGARAAALGALKGVVVNPLPWAIVLGVVSYGAGLRLPAPVAQALGLLADAASPVALFTIGAVLAAVPEGGAARARRDDALPVALLKLLVHPLLVFAAGWLVLRAGVALDRSTLTVMTLVAALPSASNVVMLAERYGADGRRIARIVMNSTALAFLTFSAAVALLT